MTWVFHAQRATTLEWLHRELPLELETLRWDLSGPGALRATIAPELAQLRAQDGRLLLQEWSTLLYAEWVPPDSRTGELRWGGILVSSEFTGAQWTIEAAGFTTYPHGIPYGERYRKAQVNPMIAVDEIWDHLQAQPGGDLNLEIITDPCPVLVGKLKTPDHTEYFLNGGWTTDRTGFVPSASSPLAKSIDGNDHTVVLSKIDRFNTLTPPYPISIGAEDLQVTARSGLKLTVTRGLGRTEGKPHSKGTRVTFEGTRTRVVTGDAAEPYELAWFEAPDCGSELDDLAAETPLDYIERHFWAEDEDSDDDGVRHQVAYRYPRAGRRRDDLAFVLGDNVADVVTINRSGDDFANDVVGLGKGEGVKTVRASSAVRDGRLRRCAVITDKAAGRTATLQAKTRAALAVHKLQNEITGLTVRDHPNAPIGSWELGDDIPVTGTVPWLGHISVWCRVIGWELVDETTAKLNLTASEAFAYGPTPAPPKAAWALHGTFTLADPTSIMQGIAYSPDATLYTSQGTDDGYALLTKWAGTVATGTMRVTDVHGDYLTALGGDLLRIKRSGTDFRYVSWEDGATVRPDDLPPAPVPSLPAPRRTAWLQDELIVGDVLYRYYGCAFTPKGPRYPKQPTVRPHVQVIVNGQIERKLYADAIGRNSKGAPIDGKLEPEGITMVDVDGVPHLIVGVSIGTKGKYRLQLYRYPLALV